ncbi:MAG: YybS family protein [Coprobacillus sp.]|nr:YybS family protein [Coprobacillus sp.]
MFKKKETLVENMTYMAIMAAINVVFVLLTTFVPVLMFLIVFILPLTSTMVTLCCKRKYFIIYAVVTILLCMLVTMYNISDTLFYVIPSIITGFVFGIMVIYKVPAVWIIFSTSIIQLGVSYAMIPFIEWLLGINIIDVFASAFGVADFIYLDYVTPCFIYFLALVQCALTYIVIRNELPKFHYETSNVRKHWYLEYIAELSCFLLILIFAFTYKPLTYLFFMLAIYFMCFIAGEALYTGGKPMWITLPIALVIGLIAFAATYQYFEEPFGLLGLGIAIVLVDLVSVCNEIKILVIKTKEKLSQDSIVPLAILDENSEASKNRSEEEKV